MIAVESKVDPGKLQSEAHSIAAFHLPLSATSENRRFGALMNLGLNALTFPPSRTP